MQKVNILYEDKFLIVVVKPAGMPSQDDRTSSMDMVSWLRNYIHRQYIGVVHRLDRNVGGIMVYALTKEAAAGLSRKITSGDFSKKYKAVVTGMPVHEAGELTDYLIYDRRKNYVSVTEKTAEGAKKAVLKYRTTGEYAPGLSSLDIELLTGRQHQIRVQTANAGFGIMGDIKYNKVRTEEVLGQKTRGIRPYLFASELSFIHPKTGERMNFSASPEWPG